jgi:hypothetical protein
MTEEFVVVTMFVEHPGARPVINVYQKDGMTRSTAVSLARSLEEDHKGDGAFSVHIRKVHKIEQDNLTIIRTGS